MPINELQAGKGKVDVIVEVIEKGEPRTFEKFGKPGRVANAKVKDETGEIKLTLWNEDIDNVNVGDKLHITNGYVSEWQGELQLSTGKFGKMEIVGKSAVGPSEPATEEPTEEEPKVDEETDEDLNEEEPEFDEEKVE